MTKKAIANDWYQVLNAADNDGYDMVIEGYLVEQAWWFDEYDPSEFFAAFDELARTKKNVKIGINSGGGSMYAGFTIYDHIRNSSATVEMCCFGMAASMAGVVLQAADKRTCLPNSRMMTHKPQGGYGGESAGMRQYADDLDKLEAKVVKLFMERTGKDEATVKSWFKSNIYIWHESEDMVANGLVDEVIEPPVKLSNGIHNSLGITSQTTEKQAWEGHFGKVTMMAKPAAKPTPLTAETKPKPAQQAQNSTRNMKAQLISMFLNLGIAVNLTEESSDIEFTQAIQKLVKELGDDITELEEKNNALQLESLKNVLEGKEAPEALKAQLIENAATDFDGAMKMVNALEDKKPENADEGDEDGEGDEGKPKPSNVATDINKKLKGEDGKKNERAPLKTPKNLGERIARKQAEKQLKLKKTLG